MSTTVSSHRSAACPTPLFAAAALVSLAAWAPSAAAQTGYPMLMSASPTAVCRGETSEVTIKSRYSLHDAHRVLVSGAGVEGEAVLPEAKPDAKNVNLTSLKLKFTVAADAELGVRDFRIATPRGVSTIGQLVVVRDPVIVEQKDNDSAEKAQEIPVPCAACGAIEKAEDVDYFKFHAAAGQALSFHVRCMRLQDRIHDLQQHADPIITLRSAGGATLASADNEFYGDPFIGHVFEREGDYLLEIRDVRYQGNAYWEYAIEISDRPFVTNVYPLAVAPGAGADLELVGFATGAAPQARWEAPADCAPGPRWSALPLGDDSSNPVPLVVSDIPLVDETAQPNQTPEQAQLVALPAGINGRISEEGDIDCFAFECRKGEAYSFEVVARRQQSAIDSHLRLLSVEGKQLALNDDLQLGKRRYADSWIENWTAPADGKYAIEIRDLHLRGGPEFVYFIRAERAEPAFELYADTDKTQLSPGVGGVVFVRAVRKNGFQGEIQLAVDGLPPGVTAECGRILAKGEDGCIVLQAAPDAQLAVGNVVIRGVGTHQAEGAAPRELQAEAAIYQETYQPGGGRGHWPVEVHTVNVGAPGDILGVVLSAAEVTLKPGASQTIDVKLLRAPEFKSNVTLDVQFRHLSGVFGSSLPEGVTLDANASKTLLTNGASEGQIVLKAAETAPEVTGQVACVMANVSLNFVMKSTYSSQPLRITVEKK